MRTYHTFRNKRLSPVEMPILGDWWSEIILGEWWKSSDFLVIGELTNLILVIGDLGGGVYTPPPPVDTHHQPPIHRLAGNYNI